MLHASKMGIVVLAVAGFAFAVLGAKPADASCQLVTATHSADSKAEAATSSRALALQSAYELEAFPRLELRQSECAEGEGRPILEGGSSRWRSARGAAQA